MRRKELFYYVTWGSNVTRAVHWCVTVFYQQIENSNIANQIHGFTIDYGKFILTSYRNTSVFRVLPNFPECFYNLIETRSPRFLFLLENTATRKRKIICQLWLSKCKFSLLAPSLRQQRALVLCLHRVTQTRFLTNQRACFLTTVF